MEETNMRTNITRHKELATLLVAIEDWFRRTNLEEWALTSWDRRLIKQINIAHNNN